MHILSEILLSIFYLFLFIIIIRKLAFFKLEGIHKNILPAILILKVILGSLLILVYTYYYPDRLKADIFKYFDDSKIMFNALFEKPLDYFQMLFGIRNDSPYFDNYYTEMNNWYRQYETNIYNDSHIIIRFNAFVRIFSFGYLSVHTLFMSFISLAGQTALYKFLKENSQLNKFLVLIASFLIPSVIFWTSGVLKEGLMFFALGFFMLYSYRIINKFSIVALFWVIFPLILLAYLKFYIIASVLPLLMAYYWCLKTRNRNVLIKYIIVIVLFLIVGFNFHYLFPNYNLVEIMVTKQNDFIYLALDEESGSLFFYEKLKPEFFFLLKKTPAALINVFFVPHIFMNQSIISYASAIENLLILLLILFTLLHISTKKLSNSFLLFCLTFTLFTFILIGLTTPVYGAIVRYKIPALPFLFTFIFMIIDEQKVKRSFRNITKIFNKCTHKP